MTQASTDSPSPPLRTDRRTVALAAALFVVTFAVFIPTLWNDFVNYDDRAFILENPQVNTGLTGENIAWAFTNTRTAGWFPLTWLSHMLDMELWGTNAMGHHLVSVTLHALSAALLFVALRWMTGAVWPSAIVAALFALHPLRVEAVAWAAERKGVLSGVFWMLTLCAYARYAARPGVGRYALVMLGMALGLMSKAVLVTLPCVLLLLDIWPLRRWRRDDAAQDDTPFARASAGRLIGEKLPLLALGIADVTLTLMIASTRQERSWVDPWPFDVRFAAATQAYVEYMIDIVWPHNLMIPHLIDHSYSAAHVGGALALLAVITAGVVWAAWRRPAQRGYLAVGWLWFLGVTAPMSGLLLQIMDFSRADRYSYLPSIGLLILVVWAVCDLVRDRPMWRRAAVAATVVALAALSTATVMQLRHWRNPQTLTAHTLSLDPDNPVAHMTRAIDLGLDGRWSEAAPHYRAAADLRPDDPQRAFMAGAAMQEMGDLEEAVHWFEEANRRAAPYGFPAAHTSLGALALERGDLDMAEQRFRAALDADSQHTTALINLGHVALRRGDAASAVRHFGDAVATAPDHVEANYHLGVALGRIKRHAEAIDALRHAASLDPDQPRLWLATGNAMMLAKRFADAAHAYSHALAASPNDADAHSRRGMALANTGNTDGAVFHLREAARLQPDMPGHWDNLGMVLLHIGQRDEAIDAFNRALQLDPTYAPAQQHLDAARRNSKTERKP